MVCIKFKLDLNSWFFEESILESFLFNSRALIFIIVFYLFKFLPPIYKICKIRMQFGNNSASSNSNTFPPKTNNNFFPQFLPMNPFMNMMSSMTPFPSFGYPPVDFVQMKLMQSMFEKFVQSQMQRAPNVNPSLLMPAFENQFLMAMLNDNFLKAKTQPQQVAEQMATPIKEEFILNQLARNVVESNSTQPIININTHLNNKPKVEENKTSESPLKPEEAIREMLLYFVKQIGTVRRTVLEKDGESIHRNNEELKEIFMGLMKKFLSSRKTKEEKIKYVLRKCFKFMKDKLLEETGFTFDSTDDYTEKLNSDKVDKMFFKHYFSEKCGKQKKFLTKNEITCIKDISMPFRFLFFLSNY